MVFNDTDNDGTLQAFLYIAGKNPSKSATAGFSILIISSCVFSVKILLQKVYQFGYWYNMLSLRVINLPNNTMQTLEINDSTNYDDSMIIRIDLDLDILMIILPLQLLFFVPNP